MKLIAVTSAAIMAAFGYLFTQAPAEKVSLQKIAYPFHISYLHFTLQKQKVKMAYMDVKPKKANGHAVVLLHGKNFCGAYWDQTALVLSKYGYRVIVPDQIGFGKSTRPDNLQYSFQMMAENTKMLLDTLRVKTAVILGNSMGGMLAARFAIMYPGSTERLILEDPIGLEDWKLKVPYQPVEKWYAKELKNDYESIKQYELENYYHGEWKPEYDKWVDMQVEWAKGKDRNKIAWNSALQYDMIYTQPVCYEFNKIKAPTLLIVGKLDKTAPGKELVSDDVKKELGNYPKLGKETAHRIPRCKLVELDSVGHIPHIEAYDEFMMQVLRFLKGMK